MAFNPDPNLYFDGITFDSGGMYIPFDALDAFDETDIRSLLYALNKKVSSIYNTTNAADKPNEMNITESQFYVPETQKLQDSITLTFNVDYNCNAEVVAEPS